MCALSSWLIGVERAALQKLSRVSVVAQVGAPTPSRARGAIMTPLATSTRALTLAIAALGLLAVTAPGHALSPDALTPPGISGPLYDGATVVEVHGLLPDAAVAVYADGDPTPRGEATCWYSRCTVVLSTPLSAGETIRAIQTVENVQSHPTRAADAPVVAAIPAGLMDGPEALRKPEIGPPLVDCQKVARVTSVVPGSLVRLYRKDAVDAAGRARTPWADARVYAGKLTAGDQLEASQEIKFPESARSKPAAEVLDKPDHLATPRIEPDVVVGGNALAVHDLQLGADVEIFRKSQDEAWEKIVTGVAYSSSQVFKIEPFTTTCHRCLKVEQSLCEVSADSLQASVADSLERPIVRGPVCAGSWKLDVCKGTPNAELQAVIQGNPDRTVASQGAEIGCSPMTIAGTGGTETLKAGQQIVVTAAVDGLTIASAPAEVRTTSRVVAEVQGGAGGGTVFVRAHLSRDAGPVFRAVMCGAEAAKVDVHAPGGALIETIDLDERTGMRGQFDGRWNWATIGWTSSTDVPLGEYKATFTIAGKSFDRYFYVTTAGCADKEALCAHNAVRADVAEADPSVPPVPSLRWSAALATTAQDWATTLDMQQTLQHSGPGENISAGAGSYQDAIDGWADESSCFQNENFPNIYNGKCPDDLIYFTDGTKKTCAEADAADKWRCAGHYSQLVWSETAAVGCGSAGPFWVCQYAPHGNVQGGRAYPPDWSPGP
jgi:hypothetical protein